MQIFLNKSFMTSFYSSVTKRKVVVSGYLGAGTLAGVARLQTHWSGYTDQYFSVPGHRQQITRFFHTTTSSVTLDINTRNLAVDIYIDGTLQHSYTRIDMQNDVVPVVVGIGNHVVKMVFTHTAATSAVPYFSFAISDSNSVEVMPRGVPVALPDSAVFCQQDIHDRVGNIPVDDEDKFTLSIYPGTMPSIATIELIMSDSVARAPVFGTTGWQANGLSSTPALIHEHNTTVSLIKHEVDDEGQIVGLRLGLESLLKIQAIDSGLATWFVLALTPGVGYDSKGYSVIGTVGTIGSGADLEMTDTNIVVSNSYIIANLRLPLSRHYV